MTSKRFIAGIAALTMISSAVSCGSTSKDSSSSAAQTASSSTAGTQTEASSENAENTEETASTEASSESGETEKTTSASSSEAASTETDSKTTKSSGGSTDTAVTTTKAPSGGTDTKVTTTKSGSSSGTSTTTSAAQAPTEAEEEEKVYTAEISLGSSTKVTGDGVDVDGSTIRITSGGDYLFTGKLSDGQIYVSTNTEEKVTIVLNGVDIACSYGPAIMINEAKKCTVKVKEGSVNNLSDSYKDKINDGVIFSNDTLRIKGNGTLNITAGNAHGIASDDDIIIDNGIINVTAVKSGLFAHDDITINGGTLNVTGGTNGMKSKGTVNINGGTSCFCGGGKEEKYSVYSTYEFCFTGGALFAAGNDSSSVAKSDFPYVVADLGSTSGGTAVKVSIGSTQIASFTPVNAFSQLLILSQDISSGSTVSVTAGSNSGSVTVSDGKNTLDI